MQARNEAAPWKVLLIGGNSGAGKTTVSQEIARRYAIMCCQVDDFRLVLQRVIPPEQHPVLHYFLSTENVWLKPPEELCQALVDVAEVVSYGLQIVVANHVATNAPLVLEGDGILPSMAAQRVFAGLDVGEQVRSVFLVEVDEQGLLESMHARGRGFHDRQAEEQANQARASILYGQRLKREAERYQIPVLGSRPWGTLPERVMAAVR